VVCWFSTIFFLSYYFLNLLIFFFFQDTYNTWLKKRYKNDPSTHSNLNSNLWLKAGSSSRPDWNWVYGLSNTTFKDLRMACSVSTIGFSQSVSSTQTLELKEILDQRVQARTTYLDADYEQLSTEMTELLWLVMEMRSQMSGTCAPPYWPYDPG
jgi:hypothetical protein